MDDGAQGDAVRARFGLDQPPEEVGQQIIAQLRNVFGRNLEDRHVTVPNRCKSVWSFLVATVQRGQPLDHRLSTVLARDLALSVCERNSKRLCRGLDGAERIWQGSLSGPKPKQANSRFTRLRTVRSQSASCATLYPAERGGMVDVSRWLAEHGLGHHAKTFAKHGVGADVLRDLTDADLKELGLNLGDRKRLLKAIAALAAGPTDARAETAQPTEGRRLLARPSGAS